MICDFCPTWQTDEICDLFFHEWFDGIHDLGISGDFICGFSKLTDEIGDFFPVAN